MLEAQNKGPVYESIHLSRPFFKIDQGTGVITGASSGIGEAMAREWAPRAKRLILVARRKEKLLQIASELEKRNPKLTVQIEVCDLSRLEEAQKLVHHIERQVKDLEIDPIDFVINNAGVGRFGFFDRQVWNDLEAMITLNATTLAYLCHAFSQSMVARGQGGILNVSSGFGLSFLPGFAGYIATKHFVTGLTESFRLDIQSAGVVVSQVCPGPVATEFASNTGAHDGTEVPDFLEISAEKCARASLMGFEKGKALIYPDWKIRFLMALNTIIPKSIQRWIYSGMAERTRQFKKV